MVTFKLWVVGYKSREDGIQYSDKVTWVNLTPEHRQIERPPLVATVENPVGILALFDATSTPKWEKLLESPVTDFSKSAKWTWDVRRNIVSKGAPLDVKLLVLIGGLVLLGVVITQKGKIPIPAPPV